MQIRPRKRMGFLLIALSPLFLFNPDIAVFDLLPDVIGYMMLSMGLSSLSYLNHHFEESAKRFHRMVAISAARLAFVVVLFGLVNSTDRPTTMLLGNFVFGVLELMTLLPAYSHLFEGLIYAGSRVGVGKSVFRPTAAAKLWSLIIKRKSEFDGNTAVTATESFSFMTAVFAVLKVTLNVLPEFSVLTEHSDKAINLYVYVWMFRVAAVLLGAVIGIVWLLLALRYYFGVLRDREFVDALHAQYMRDVYPNKDLFVARRYKLGSFFLLLGMMLSLDLPMDGVNILPDVLCAFCLAAGVLALRHYAPTWKASVAVLAAYALQSAVEWFWQIRYFKIEEYTAQAALNGAEATNAHIVSIVLSAIGAVLFVLSVLGVLGCLRDVIRLHTGYEVKHVDMQTYGRMNAIHKQLIRGLLPVLIMTVICALGSVAYTVMLPFSGMGGDWYRVLASLWWVIDLFLGVVLVVVFSEKNNDIMEQLSNRYMLSGITYEAQTE
ncbi:MAG: hypothetical protein IIX86_00495 [Clostridia bacterium]|nr:hypothetical protein [Clostridia bacterium]